MGSAVGNDWAYFHKEKMISECNIQNAELLTKLFERFPSFHDSEVVQVILDRKVEGKVCPTLTAKIRVFDAKINCLATLKFFYIFGLKLENFNHQNVLGDLEIKAVEREDFESFENDKRLLGIVSKDEVGRQNFKVKFYFCFGVEADFLCSTILVEDVQLLADRNIDWI